MGIENSWLDNIEVRPNPSTGLFTLQVPEPTIVTVMDSMGRRVIETTANGRFTWILVLQL